MKIILYALILCLPVFLYGKEKGININYDWEVAPIPYVPSEEDKKEDALILFEKHARQFACYAASIRRYELMHVKKYLHTDKAIEDHNKFYIWTKGSTTVYKLKARVIQPSGKIIELTEQNIIESKDESGRVKYRYFVFEGIEKGSMIEYLHYICYEEPSLMSQHYIGVSGDTKKKKLEIDILFQQDRLGLSSFSTNGLQVPVSDGSKLVYSNDTYLHYYIHMEDVDPTPNERYSFDPQKQQQLFFTLFATSTGPYASSNSNQDLYKRLSQNLYYNVIYNPVDQEKKTQKAVDEFIERNIKPSDSTNLLKVRALEKAIKAEFSLVETGASDIGTIFTMKSCDESGAIRLMVSLTHALKIPTKLVLSCDRRDFLFPTNYEGYIFLDEIMIYFPELEVYYHPASEYRIGAAPYQYVTNHGLFIETKKLPDLYGYGIIHTKDRIAAPRGNYSIDEIRSNVTIDLATAKANIQLDRSVSGYFAQPYQAGISSLNETDLKALKESFFTYVVSESAQLGEYSFENDRSEDFNSKPLTGHAIVTLPTLIIEAGDKLLVNLGTLIGPQSDMYQEKAEGRKSPVDFDYPHQFQRTITLTIPEGYQVVNAADFNKSVKPDADSNSLGFVSECKIIDNQLIVTISEWYNQITYPKEQYGYVIAAFNAAADFNALVLVLEKTTH